MKNLFIKLKVTLSRLSIFDKRQRFIIQTLVLTAGIIILQQNWTDFKFPMIIFISLLTYAFTAWSLKEDIRGMEWLLLFILPVLFTVSLSLFYFLLPNRMIYRVGVTLFFIVGSYAVLLVENIFNVAVARSIQLTRAAQSVGLLISLIIIFLASNIIYSLRFPFYANFLAYFFLIILLSLQSLWSVNLEEKLSKEIIIDSFAIGLGIGELSIAISFWPVVNASYSLLITAAYYSLVSLFQQHLSKRLFKSSIKELIYVFLFTLILLIITTTWN